MKLLLIFAELFYGYIAVLRKTPKAFDYKKVNLKHTTDYEIGKIYLNPPPSPFSTPVFLDPSQPITV